jgi:uncharacterized membrane protein (UPF0136 family)
MHIKKSTSLSVLFYGLILIALAFIGYINAGSKVSLYMGLTFGIALTACAGLMFSQIKVGEKGATLLTLILFLVFGLRFAITGKTIPCVLTILSAGMLILLLSQTIKWKK